YNVKLKDIPGWREPAPQSVRLVGGVSKVMEMAYERIPEYVIGEIPPLSVWHGSKLEFSVANKAGFSGNTVTYKVDKNPAGSLSFEAGKTSQNKIFTYIPNAA